MLKTFVLSIALALALGACGGSQTPAEAHAARHTDNAEAQVAREEQETEAAEDDLAHAQNVEDIIDENNDDDVQEAGEVIDNSN